MQPTKSGRLSEVARHLVLPDGITSTEWPSIRDRTRAMGVHYDQWQADLVRGTFAKRADGKYAATVGGIVWSLPRQVGKTFTVGSLLFAYGINHPGSLILWTAHHRQTAKETFQAMQSFARKREIRPHVAHVYTGAGDESVVFHNGSRILFGSRDRGFGLGFAGVDVIVFDEAQRLNDQTRMDMVPATNRPHNPCGALLFYIGTPPRPNDSGDGFAGLRDKALSGAAPDMFFVEMSADADADPDDREQWKKGNPSYPSHTPEESMLRMREHLGSDEAWMRDALGVWDAVRTSGVIPFDAWTARSDEHSVPVESFALGVEVGPDMAWASVVMAGQRADGDWHVQLDEQRSGAAWTVAYVKGLVDANPQIRAVVVDVGGPIAGLLDQFKSAKVRLTPIRVRDLGAACSRMLDGTVTGWLHNTGQPQMDVAVKVAGKRSLGDTGMWVFSRKSATSDITPVQAGALALWGAQNSDVKKPVMKRRKVVVLQ